MRTKPASVCAVLLLLSGCSGGDPSRPASDDAGAPLHEGDAAADAALHADANTSDAGKGNDADAGPTCDIAGTASPTKLYSTNFELGPDKLQAYGGILYWASTDSNDDSGKVNAYVLSQSRYFSMYSDMSVRSLNVDTFGVYFTDFAAVSLQRFDLNGGNYTVFSTVSGNYPVLRTDGGYELFVGTAVDHSDNELYLTNNDGQWDLNHGLKGAFTEFVAADTTNVYIVMFAEPTNGPKEVDVVGMDRNLDMSSVVELGGAYDQEPTGFAIDATSVYVATKGTGSSLAVSPKSGGSWKDLVVEGGLENLAVGTTYVYFTDSAGRLRRVAKDGSKPAEIVFTPCGRITTVTTVDDTAYFIQSTESSDDGMVLWSVK